MHSNGLKFACFSLMFLCFSVSINVSCFLGVMKTLMRWYFKVYSFSVFHNETVRSLKNCHPLFFSQSYDVISIIFIYPDW